MQVAGRRTVLDPSALGQCPAVLLEVGPLDTAHSLCMTRSEVYTRLRARVGTASVYIARPGGHLRIRVLFALCAHAGAGVMHSFTYGNASCKPPSRTQENPAAENIYHPLVHAYI